MDNRKKETDSRMDDRAGPQPARTGENLIGGDDIGLPTGMQPEEAGKPDQMKPDPDKLKDKNAS